MRWLAAIDFVETCDDNEDLWIIMGNVWDGMKDGDGIRWAMHGGIWLVALGCQLIL